jgi:hypothetical protein
VRPIGLAVFTFVRAALFEMLARRRRPKCMKRLMLVAMVLGICGGAARAATNGVTYFVQLIVATNGEKPPDAKAKVGPKLQKDLSPVFQWANYWELSRKKVETSIGKRSRIRLGEGRELELEHVSGGRLVVRLFRDGKLIRKMKGLVPKCRVIMGGDGTGEEAWFVVIRRDEPSSG